jgi:hypothetical protein
MLPFHQVGKKNMGGNMNISEAILSFSQSEKIKSGLIWAIHLSEIRESIPQNQRRGAEKSLEALIDLIGHETRLTGSVIREKAWDKAGQSIDMALVMIRSKVPEESSFHLTNAITHVTSLGQRAMTYLKDQGYL